MNEVGILSVKVENFWVAALNSSLYLSMINVYQRLSCLHFLDKTLRLISSIWTPSQLSASAAYIKSSVRLVPYTPENTYYLHLLRRLPGYFYMECGSQSWHTWSSDKKHYIGKVWGPCQKTKWPYQPNDWTGWRAQGNILHVKSYIIILWISSCGTFMLLK